MSLKKSFIFTSFQGAAIAVFVFYSNSASANDFSNWLKASSNAADPKSLTTSSASGGLVLPDGKVLNDGDLIFGINNYQPGIFSTYAKGTNYLFGLGIFPHIELTGRLADYPINRDGLLGVRDLSANLKFSIPKIVRYQPDIAIGKNDVGGGAVNFQSKYLVASEDFGPLQIRAGYAKGSPSLNGKFGGISMRFGQTGISGIIDRDSRVTHAGLRYTSPQLINLNSLRISATLQRSRGDRDLTGRAADSTTASFHLILPLGQKEVQSARAIQYFEPVQANTSEEIAALQATANTLRPDRKNGSSSSESLDVNKLKNRQNGSPSEDMQNDWVQQLKSELFAAGMERVRVGKSGNELIVEYENHRYNQNEIDALGVVLGIADKLVPSDVERIAAATKKAGLRISKTSVNRAIFHQFLVDGIPYAVKDTMSVDMGAGGDEKVVWLDQEEGKRGLSRVRIEPYLVKFVGTEFAVFDHSLSANIQGFVPLWTGAEFVSSYISKISESNNVANGVFSYAKQRTGVKTAVVTQSFWLSNHIFNQISTGKFLYDKYGFENETTWLLPKEGDYLRFQIANIWDNTQAKLKTDFTVGASYMWKYNPLDLGVEVSYQRYVGNDYGPKIQVNRWFGDVNAQMFLRKSNLETRVGFGLVFPMTTRKGMSPGITHLEGTSDFSARMETQLARPGECNCITRGPLEERNPVYSSDIEVFNRNRFGKIYIGSQLFRLRDNALLFMVAQ